MKTGELLSGLQRATVMCVCGHGDHRHFEWGYGHSRHEAGMFHCADCNCPKYQPKET